MSHPPPADSSAGYARRQARPAHGKGLDSSLLSGPLDAMSTDSVESLYLSSSYRDVVDGTYVAPEVFYQTRARYFDRTWTHLIPEDRNSRILDAGCGSGALLWWLQARGYRNSQGIDLSKPMVDQASAAGVKSVFVGNAFQWLTSERSGGGMYDVIILRDVLEHLSPTSVIEMVGIVRSALRPGGRLIAQVPNAEAPAFGRIRYGDFTHQLAFTTRSISQVLSAGGFVNLAFWPAAPWYPLGKRTPQLAILKVVELMQRIVLYGVAGRRNAIVSESLIAVACGPGERDGGA
jgi:2-polyprenyl-3-methyl-5-hydroxy-6-metoxy-1,4-benzoquinol methylase